MARLAIRMPKMSMTMTEGEMGPWLVDEGAHIESGDVVCEVMTDKVDMEVESTVSGVLVEIVAREGMVAVGEPIAWVEGEDDGGGFGDLLTGAPEPVSTPEPESNLAPADAQTDSMAPTPGEATARTLITPAVPRARALAAEHNLSLDSVTGSGPDGRVLMGDVESRLAPTLPPVDAPSATAAKPDRRAAIRKIVARTLEPAALIPQFTVWRELHLDQANTTRGRRSWTGVILRAYSAALKEVPELLTRWTEDGPVPCGPPAIALAVATDRGLLVPVFVEPDATDPDTFDAELRAVVAAAQRGKVGPDYLGIANASLSNMGGLGVDRFQALITPPQASILALGSITERPVAVPGGVGLALTVHAGLTVDHRAGDGVHAAQLLESLKKALDPSTNPLT